MRGIFGKMQAAPLYASGLSMATRSGAGAAVAASSRDRDPVVSEFESENSGRDEGGDSDDADVGRPWETTQGRSGGPPARRNGPTQTATQKLPARSPAI